MALYTLQPGEKDSIEISTIPLHTHWHATNFGLVIVLTHSMVLHALKAKMVTLCSLYYICYYTATIRYMYIYCDQFDTSLFYIHMYSTFSTHFEQGRW